MSLGGENVTVGYSPKLSLGVVPGSENVLHRYTTDGRLHDSITIVEPVTPTPTPTSNTVHLLSSSTLAKAHGNPTLRYDEVLKSNTVFTSGGWAIFNSDSNSDPNRGTSSRGSDQSFGGDRQGSFGWLGMGGSALQWHNELKVGFGYCGNLFGANLNNRNSMLVQNSVLDCARNIQKHN